VRRFIGTSNDASSTQTNRSSRITRADVTGEWTPPEMAATAREVKPGKEHVVDACRAGRNDRGNS